MAQAGHNDMIPSPSTQAVADANHKRLSDAKTMETAQKAVPGALETGVALAKSTALAHADDRMQEPSKENGDAES